MKSKRQKTEDGTFIKIRFYFMSLWLLFVLIFLLTIDVQQFFSITMQRGSIGQLLKSNWLPLTALFLAILGWSGTSLERRRWTGVTNPPYKIESIKNINFEYLTFLTTYIVPLVSFDFSKIRYVVVLAVLLVLIGFIFIRMDLYCANPTLALMGYRLYRANVKGLDVPEGIVLISKDRLSIMSSIKWIPIDELIWVAKEVNNDV